ncbi:MAG: hypothetical protein ACRERD_22920 [Candidatus Binatia bacterium]
MTRYFKYARVAILAILSLAVFAPDSEARLYWNSRRAAVLESFLALRETYDGGCDQVINGNCVSSWNYLASDEVAYEKIKNAYGCNLASDWKQPWDYCGQESRFPTSFFEDIWSYGYDGVGRGGQCKFFVNLILYRSGTDQRILPPYSHVSVRDMFDDSTTDLTRAREGDIIFRHETDVNGKSSLPHIAIVVEIKRDVYGRVTGLDVIDSNYTPLSDDRTRNREVIGRHLFSLSQLRTLRYRIWTGVSYYGESYVP